jgi:hypothetical protein
MVIERFEEKNVGKYSCEASNSGGQVLSKEMTIPIIYAKATIEVSPKTLKLKLGETASLNCKVKNTSGDYKLKWIDKFGKKEITEVNIRTT